MNIQQAIAAVIDGKNLNAEDMTAVMRAIMTGEATPSQIGGFLVGLRVKGETAEEIAAAAAVMRGLATKVNVGPEHLVDTCGTGGDGAETFNISTASALVTAAAGGRVAKHGNRSVSSKSGSADVLEAAGVKLDLGPEQVGRCIEAVGFGFLFAPAHHGAMKHAIGPRREMAVRTIFNLLGPLTNPAGAPNQVIGVFSEHWVVPMAEVLGRLGSNHVFVVHAEDGLDEISIGAPTVVAELRDGEVRSYRIAPEDFGLERGDIASLKVESAQDSLATVKRALNNESGPARDVVLLNSGAAICAAGLADDLQGGVQRARDAIAPGAAASTLDRLVALSQSM
ncbi:MAG: anthranilate phosphoribosyltransferase [Gammaproteobacteria bacterium]